MTILPPEGYAWLEEVAKKENINHDILRKLCEQEYIQAVKLKNKWAIRVVDDRINPYSSIVVRDLQSGGNITIEKIISQVTVSNPPSSDFGEIIRQQPIRDKLETARHWIKLTFVLLTGGSAFFIVGLVLTIPIAALTMIPAMFHAVRAFEVANSYGDKYLIHEAQKIRTQAIFVGSCLWSLLMVFCLISVALMAAEQ